MNNVIAFLATSALYGLLVACGQPRQDVETSPSASAEEVIATYDGGSIALPAVEERLHAARTPACIEMKRSPGEASLDQLIPCYREVVEGLFLERSVLAAIDDVDAKIETLEEYQRLKNQTFLMVYHESMVENIEIDDADIESFYQDNRDRFHRPAQLTLRTIFRRHENPDDQEQTIMFLRSIRQRYLNGETFDSLARTYSHSETRLRGGLVGLVHQGQLPQRLETVAFALRDGEVSEPVLVRDGAVLLQVRNLVAAVDYSLQSVREQISNELIAQRVQEITAERVARLTIPQGSIILSSDELTQALVGDDQDRVVLAVAGEPLTVQQLRQRVGLHAAAEVTDLDESQMARALQVYEEQKTNRLLLYDLLQTRDPELLQQVTDRLHDVGAMRLVDSMLLEEMGQLVDSNPDELHRYWEDNRHLYQTPLRFKAQVWSVPFDDDPPRQLRRMEELQERLIDGQLDITGAVTQLGGNVADLGWQELPALREKLPPKALTYLLEIGASGFSPVYQQDNALHLLRLEERREPETQEYEVVKDRVRSDYLTRFQEQLYHQILQQRLEAADFVFDEQAARRLLEPPFVAS